MFKNILLLNRVLIEKKLGEYFLVFFFIALMLFSVIAVNKLPEAMAATKSTKSKFSEYTNSDFRYQLQYPSNWAKVDNKSDNVSFGPSNKSLSSGKGCSPQFHIKASNDTSLSRVPFIIDNTLHAIKNAKIMDRTPFSLAGNTGYYLAWSYSKPGDGCGKLVETRAVLQTGDNSYDITFRAETADYKKLLPKIQSMLASFTILPGEQALTEKTGSEILRALQPGVFTEKTGGEILKALQPHSMSEDTGHAILKALQSQGVSSPINSEVQKDLADQCEVGASATTVVLLAIPGAQQAAARVGAISCQSSAGNSSAVN
jgi:hypothetical protein